MIRRKKSDVLKDMPKKTYTYLPIQLDNEKEYRLAEDNFIEYMHNKLETELKKDIDNISNKYNIDIDEQSLLEEAKINKLNKINLLTEIESLKQIAVKGKLNNIIDWVNDFLESGEKLVLFAVHKFVINEVIDKFKKIAVKIDGSVSMGDRQKAIEQFQNNKSVRLFIGNIKAAGVGITLTAASSVAFLELPWTPGELEQAIDRVHRIGQKNAVMCYFLIAVNTIETRIAQLLDKKRKILDSVLDGKETDEKSLLTELIKSYK